MRSSESFSIVPNLTGEREEKKVNENGMHTQISWTSNNKTYFFFKSMAMSSEMGARFRAIKLLEVSVLKHCFLMLLWGGLSQTGVALMYPQAIMV